MVDATVHVVERGAIRTDFNHVLEGAVMGTADEPNPETRMGDGPVYNLVVEHPEGTILWDTGSHPEADSGHWPAELYAAFEHRGLRPIEDDLDDAGFDPDDIDYVIQSHLHLDHAGGLYAFEGTDTPVLVHEDELKYAYYGAKTDAGDDAYVAGDFDRDLNWEVVHRDREQRFEGIELLHLPGHTPGLLGVKLDLPDRTVIVAGDQAYVRANYDEGRPMGGSLLWSKRAWFDSLRLVEDEQRRENAKVICGHDADDLDWLRAEL